jgi:hypothetical protein
MDSATREDIVLSLQRISPSVQFSGVVVQRIYCLWESTREQAFLDMLSLPLLLVGVGGLSPRGMILILY